MTSTHQTQKFTFSHPLLGSLTGIEQSPDVIQFRTIPYARIPERFRQCVPIETLEEAERDCTEYGPACPQLPQDAGAFGGWLPGEKLVHYDELRCLNLTVTVPKVLLQNGGEVPVMVHVHGGGFNQGSHTNGVRDTFPMVQLSLKDGTPVVIVSIHYRINWQGFLGCQDLVDEAKASGKPSTNFGLYDQRAAFQWVQKYISGFGGNAIDITAFGESAGSVSLGLQMCSNVPIFQRAVLQSGPPSLATPMTLAGKEAQYLKLLKFCGIDENDPERLKKLRAAPIQKLLEGTHGTGVLAFSPMEDKEFFPESPDYFNEASIFSKCDWVKDIMIGDAIYEGYLFSGGLQRVEPETFIQFFEQALGLEHAQPILEAYLIARGIDRNLFWTRLNTIVGDIKFSAPIHNLITSLAKLPGAKSKRIYRLGITLRNPFPGTPFYAVAGHHFIELVFQFMTLLERFPNQKLKDISIEFAQKLIGFAYGKAPWAEFDDKDQTITILSGDGWETFTRAEDEVAGPLTQEGGRRYEAWETIQRVYEQTGKGGLALYDAIDVSQVLALGR